MSTTKIKICGVNDTDFAAEAKRLGADYLGFVFAESSPRQVTTDFVCKTMHRLKGTSRCVGVFTTGNMLEVVSVAGMCGLHIVQLHRRAKGAEVAMLKALGYEVWTLAGGAEGDALLFDSSHGDGERTLRKGPFKSVLAGGISAANIGAALESGADVIDVSGSLEISRGVKSIERLMEFFDAVEFAKRKVGGKC